MSKFLPLVTTAILIVASRAMAEPMCSIGDDKRKIITALLCGQMAKEPEYKFQGPDCVKNSVRARFKDSAIQIFGAKLCGDEEFSNRLKQANIRALKFVETISICVSERTDLSSIMDASISETGRALANQKCTPEVQAAFSQRREFFEKQIEMSMNPNINSLMYEKLGIVVDSSGNVREK